MTGSETSERPIGDELLAAGWRQGSIFTGPSLRFFYNSGQAVPGERPTRSSERLVLITQDCDVKSPDEPYVEAMLCRRRKGRDYLARVAQNSARVFVIDPSPDSDSAWVVEARYHLQIEKGLLRTLAPEPWPGTPKRLEQLVRWLARRYDRPALPDLVVETFQDPVDQALRRFYEAHPALGQAFSQAVREIRVSVPSHEQPPFDLDIVILLNEEGVTAEQADAIEAAEAAIRHSLDPSLVQLSPEVRKLTEEQMSVAEYFATRPLFLEYLTYRGDEVQGAEPFGRA